MNRETLVATLLNRYVEQHLLDAGNPDIELLCKEHPELIEPLRDHVRRYLELNTTLTASTTAPVSAPELQHADPLPEFEGFRTVERVSVGGVGEIYKLEDLQLGRVVAAKVIRHDNPLKASMEDFLREARSLALFEDPRIVQIFEFRADANPPVLLMEYVDGFTLDKIGPSLEYVQRARVMIEVARAIHRAHDLGIQHRDLKPENILVDARLEPKILDFGLSRGEPDRGHGIGTLAYMAPEQLDPNLPIDERTDIYALGVILYELLCNALPVDHGELSSLGKTTPESPRLPVEFVPDVPEPLQAIALKAMEHDPIDRYATAREMAMDLHRYVEGRPVLARPTLYRSVLKQRAQPHIEDIQEWLRTNLIYPHEAQRLEASYARLEAREDDWIVGGRALSFSQITLYLGAFLIALGGLFYFHAYFQADNRGVWGAFAILALPFAGLSIIGRVMYRQGRETVAIGFYLAATLLLPIFLLIAFDAIGLMPVQPENTNELFGTGYTSNRQLQIASLVACLWAASLVVSTRTMTLSSCFTVLLFVLEISILADFGLTDWIEEGNWHVLAIYLVPLLALLILLGVIGERTGRDTAARPQYYAAVGLWVLVLELLAQNGKAFEYLGLTMDTIQGADVSDPLLLDSLTAMIVNGLILYFTASVLEKRGTPLLAKTATMLFIISPFAILQPVAYLVAVGEYSRQFDWLYLSLALVIAFLSHYRQRKSFYFAGLLNTGVALWLITSHYEWFDQPAWSVIVVITGLVVLGAGPLIHSAERGRPVG
ncbi:MAG: protein kinase [Gammaproteobacteria bacterium]|nr:protein kinase [Gammaproteobacteria bacterium]